MKKNKIFFLILSIIFILLLLYFVFDFSRKTTFPGGQGTDSGSHTGVYRTEP